jgi:DNA-binding transcriptional regulator YiaG
MVGNEVLTRENTPATELQRVVEKVIKGVKLTYNEVYYLDYDVNEDTGMINKNKSVEHYTKDQTTRNIKAQKSAYHIAKGSVTPIEIINFREKYQIAASVLSLILGFSKNTISNIENDGVTSLSSGRFIKVCLTNRTLLSQYIETCSALEVQKKNELLERLMTEC